MASVTIVLLTITALMTNGITGNMNAVFYTTKDNINCTSTEVQSHVFGPMTQRSCSVLCSKSDKLCLGFGFSNSTCELCYVCPSSANIQSPNSSDILYSTTFGNFTLELNKGNNDKLKYQKRCLCSTFYS